MRPLILHRAFPEHIARVLAERAAQRMAAAKPARPQGSAEGNSLVRNADAPNSLTQRDIQS